MNDQPQPSPSRLPKWLPTLLVVVGSLLILSHFALTAKPDGPPMYVIGILCLAISTLLRSRAKPAA